jgi:hypothetical protein
VLGRVEMFCGVFIFRRIAAGDVATDHAHPQMDPSVAHFHAFGADTGVRLQAFLDFVQVSA